MKRITFCLPVCTAILLFSGLARAEVSVEHAWVRMPPPVADTAAAYMTLRNGGDRDVVIAGISSDASETAGIHSMRKQGAMIRMSAANGMTIPAHGSVKLEPGGMHLMLIGLKRVLKPGHEVILVLRFVNAPMLRIVAPVRDPGSMREHASQLYKQAMNLLKKKDATKAVLLFRQAGEKGNRRAQYQMGLLYARGDGVPKDMAKAREWLRKAAIQGHPKAQFYLGQMYAFGAGGKKDYVKATTWFWLAKTLGDRFAGDSLEVMTGKVSSRELSEAKKRANTLWRKMPHDMKIKRSAAMH